jgi:high-affinity nickel-transport protein
MQPPLICDPAPRSSQDPGNVRTKIIAICTVLVAANVLVWMWALSTYHGYPVVLGTALLAYTFGLRHAVDADHIAAIDNVTRKLVQAGQKPAGVGLFFSLGHSRVVLLAGAVLASPASALETRFQSFRQISGLIGTTISAAFLFAIAIANFLILTGVWRTFRRVKDGGTFVPEDLDLLLANRGLLARLLHPVFKLITKSWHMYPLGFLFGLGFDTATEIGVLGMSAAGAARGLPAWSIMVFPALFTVGMTLIDTADSILMLGAYHWAFIKPIRKLYYNLTITTVSVIIAITVGGIEALGIVAGKLGLDAGFWGVIASLNDNFGTLGFVIAGIFAVSWVVSVLIYRLKGYDRIEPSDA